MELARWHYYRSSQEIPTPLNTLPDQPVTATNWSLTQANELYNVSDWSAGYFAIDAKGEVTVRAPSHSDKGATVEVSLMDVVAGLQERGLDMPVLLRIQNLLDDRISALNQAFARAITELGYRNHYRGVFPIKVNQQRHVIEEVTRFGARYNHGLEAGSKAELIIALANLSEQANDDSYIICNGYKDSEFIDLGLYALQLGIRCFFVVETPMELPVIIARSRALGIKPLIGARLKLTSKVDGHWSADSGDRSIFGLTSSQLIGMVDQLKQEQMLDCFQLLHTHLGSQIPNIRNIRTGVQEACRFYANLVSEGVPLAYLDMGGGLSVDYDGSSTNSTHSMNYRLDEYCLDMIEAIMDTLDPLGVDHPVLLTESGRATVAYSAVLLFNILDVSTSDPVISELTLPEDAHERLHNLQQVLDAVAPNNLQACHNDALAYRDDVRSLFRGGRISLRSLAWAENTFLKIERAIVLTLPRARRALPELDRLHESLADIYYGNFSIFQSLPDTWAIDQVFPIMPIHRLNEMPTRNAVLADLTCDCDGKIDHFAGIEGVRKTLPLHTLNDNEDYYVGVFLVGAYQETLGDLHNLFGDTNVASICITADGSFDITHELHGDSIADVLSYVEYHPHLMREQLRNKAENAVRQAKITVAQRRQMLEAFEASLGGYTYFER